MTTTPKLGLERIASGGQEGAEVLYNTSVNLLDFLVQPRVINMDTNAQPASPSEGDFYIIGPTPTGAQWSGNAGKLAMYSNGWIIRAAAQGFKVYNLDDSNTYVYSGSAWVADAGVSDHNSLTGLTTGDPHTQYVAISPTSGRNEILSPEDDYGLKITASGDGTDVQSIFLVNETFVVKANADGSRHSANILGVPLIIDLASGGSLALKESTGTTTLSGGGPTGDIDFTLPATAGIDGQILKASGGGGMEWVSDTPTSVNAADIGVTPSVSSPSLASAQAMTNLLNAALEDYEEIRFTAPGDYYFAGVTSPAPDLCAIKLPAALRRLYVGPGVRLVRHKDYSGFGLNPGGQLMGFDDETVRNKGVYVYGGGTVARAYASSFDNWHTLRFVNADIVFFNDITIESDYGYTGTFTDSDTGIDYPNTIGENDIASGKFGMISAGVGYSIWKNIRLVGRNKLGVGTGGIGNDHAHRSDGLHFTGRHELILIDGLSGTCSDDTIAINTSDYTPPWGSLEYQGPNFPFGNIDNVVIKNLHVDRGWQAFRIGGAPQVYALDTDDVEFTPSYVENSGTLSFDASLSGGYANRLTRTGVFDKYVWKKGHSIWVSHNGAPSSGSKYVFGAWYEIAAKVNADTISLVRPLILTSTSGSYTSGVNLAMDATAKKVTRASGTFSVTVGHYVQVRGFANAGNNSTFKVTALADSNTSLVFGEATGLVTESSGSGRTVLDYTQTDQSDENAATATNLVSHMVGGNWSGGTPSNALATYGGIRTDHIKNVVIDGGYIESCSNRGYGDGSQANILGGFNCGSITGDSWNLDGCPIYNVTIKNLWMKCNAAYYAGLSLTNSGVVNVHVENCTFDPGSAAFSSFILGRCYGTPDSLHMLDVVDCKLPGAPQACALVSLNREVDILKVRNCEWSANHASSGAAITLNGYTVKPGRVRELDLSGSKFKSNVSPTANYAIATLNSKVDNGFGANCTFAALTSVTNGNTSSSMMSYLTLDCPTFLEVLDGAVADMGVIVVSYFNVTITGRYERNRTSGNDTATLSTGLARGVLSVQRVTRSFVLTAADMIAYGATPGSASTNLNLTLLPQYKQSLTNLPPGARVTGWSARTRTSFTSSSGITSVTLGLGASWDTDLFGVSGNMLNGSNGVHSSTITHATNGYPYGNTPGAIWAYVTTSGGTPTVNTLTAGAIAVTIEFDIVMG